MGHLTLLAEDVISALDRFPTDLQSLIVSTHAPQPEWDEYVKGRYSETKKKDRCALGGPKPNPHSSSSLGSGFGINVDEGVDGGAGRGANAEGKGAGRMMVDEGTMFPGLRLDEATMDTFRPKQKIEIEQGDIEGGERKVDVPEDVGISSSGGGMRSEFRRAASESSSRGVRNTADFGSVSGMRRDEEDDDDEEKYGNSRTTHVSTVFCPLFKTYS